MNEGKPNLLEMRRLLHGHRWTDVLDWREALHALADLTDEQIDAVAAEGEPVSQHTSEKTCQ